MKSFLLPVAVLVSAAVAQTTTVCAADYIVESCLGSEKAKLANCNTGDYDCQCAAWQAILTCYNNCPNDSRLPTDVGQKDIFCGYASQFPSKATTAASPSKTSSSSATQTPNNNQAEDDATNTEDESGSSTSTGSPATNTNSAAYLALNAGGVLAAVAGVVAVVL
ncbi:hypothetical protein B0T21DRAFT_388026 [Apiosordaria backusii]|uniref:GPI anchored serine-threonine rich protein n=1 Tax=Apiosordaria backusii TaxID=314023 RepID=A0AA40DJ31_9PEZI|nr:hypothetical protein B0T21DRAFT_388026 [Apiosordaria backusii]